MANVLVIDDDQDITRLLQSQLSQEGHRVLVAHQGDEGLAKALKSPPDLIMLDVFLPDATGYQICSQLRSTPCTQTVPIIMMTGAARFSSQHQFGLDRGANEYISKPFNIIEIDKMIQKYLGTQRPVSPGPLKAIQRKAPLMETAEEFKQPTAADDLETLSMYLEQTLAQKKAAAEAEAAQIPNRASAEDPSDEAVGNGIVRISFTTPPHTARTTSAARPFHSLQAESRRPIFPAFSQPQGEEKVENHAPVQEEAPMTPIREMSSMRPLVPAQHPTPEMAKHVNSHPQEIKHDIFAPAILASKERFIEFGLDIFTLANRLCSNHAEKHVAEQLLRTSLSVGARLTESRSAGTREEFLALLHGAQKDLRETAYWLMILQKAGLLKELGKADLEKACQTLSTLLNDFVLTEEKRS